MKIGKYETYMTLHIKGYGSRLATRNETLEGVRREIDASNERAVALGYKEEQWIITKDTIETYWKDDGTFVKRVETEEFVEVYPKWD